MPVNVLSQEHQSSIKESARLNLGPKATKLVGPKSTNLVLLLILLKPLTYGDKKLYGDKIDTENTKNTTQIMELTLEIKL